MKWDHRRTLLIDTNLLILLVVGSADPMRIERFARTKGYTEDDFQRLLSVIGNFNSLASTPHLLSQTTDLIKASGAWGELAESLTSALRTVYSTDEHFVPARALGRLDTLSQFGLADTAIFDAAKRGCTVLTDDLPLHNVLLANGCRSINFTELREL